MQLQANHEKGLRVSISTKEIFVSPRLVIYENAGNFSGKCLFPLIRTCKLTDLIVKILINYNSYFSTIISNRDGEKNLSLRSFPISNPLAGSY